MQQTNPLRRFERNQRIMNCVAFMQSSTKNSEKGSENGPLLAKKVKLDKKVDIHFKAQLVSGPCILIVYCLGQ